MRRSNFPFRPIQRFRHLAFLIGLLAAWGISTATMAQEKEVIQIKAFDQQLEPMKNIVVTINDGKVIQLDNKGQALVELNANELPVKTISIEDQQLEPASWNYRKGVLEVIVRKKSYRIANVIVLYSDRRPVPSIQITFKGSQTVKAVTNSAGEAGVPVLLTDKINSTDQFEIHNHVVTRISPGERTVITVEESRAKRIIAEEQPGIQSKSESIEITRGTIDSIKSLAVLFDLLGSTAQVNNESKQQIARKYKQLLTSLSDSIVRRTSYLAKISTTSNVDEDIKNLVSQASNQDLNLQRQRDEFYEKIRIIENKLNSESSDLSPTSRNALLADLNSLEKILSESENRFFKNHNDYRQEVNSLKEKYFDYQRLEDQLSESESSRLEDQRVFRTRMIIVFGVVVILALLIILLTYFSNKFNKQRKELEKAHGEVKSINENLEDIVTHRTKSLEKANYELDTFLYRASHDLRAPLCTIRGLCQIAPYLSLEELVSKIEHTLGGMDRLLSKLGMVSLISHPSTRSEVYLHEVIGEIQMRFKDSNSDKGIQFSVNCSDEIVFWAYPNLVKFILNNLVENALFFSELGTKESRHVKFEANRNGSNIEFSVYDNGVGVDDEVQKKLFNMFFKGHELSKGNGLGLYIVSKCVQGLGGIIEVDSEPLKYTRFIVTIPVRQGNDAALTDSSITSNGTA